MNVLSIQKGSDTGGQGIRIKRAFDNHAPGWTYRTMTAPGVSDYIAYPQDMRWSSKAIKDMWPELDVVHLHNNFATYDFVQRRLKAKPAVIHYHGTQFRQNSEHFLAQQRERKTPALVSTLDLYLIAPDELEWLPAPYDADWLASLRPDRDSSIIHIARAPTNTQIKSTDAFKTATDRLKAEGAPIEVDIIEHVTWNECLRRKANADIFFDQVILGFGCNSLEAWGMGIPVVSGVDPDRARAIGHAIPRDVEAEYIRRFGSLPYYRATEDTIYDALRELVESPKLREDYAILGNKWLRQFHDEPVVVKQLQNVYAQCAVTDQAA